MAAPEKFFSNWTSKFKWYQKKRAIAHKVVKIDDFLRIVFPPEKCLSPIFGPLAF